LNDPENDMLTRFLSVLVSATFATVVLVAVAVVPAGALSAGTVTLSPPVIHESFTVLPCAGVPKDRSTLEEEGCAEQQILRTDSRIDTLNNTIFANLADDSARRQFIAGHQAWLAYRHAYCLSVSEIFEGGTEAGLVDADCVASVNGEHIKDLKEFVRNISAN
jgi:uncharacterized protein YecT (DUF1311 family)